MVGGHHGHRFALVTHHVTGQHRLVAMLESEGGATGHVLMGEDGMDSVDGQRRTRVEAPDPGRGVRRPERGTPEHPVVMKVAGEGEAAGHLGDAVRAGCVLAYPGADRRPGTCLNHRHGVASACRAAAARSTASRIRP